MSTLNLREPLPQPPPVDFPNPRPQTPNTDPDLRLNPDPARSLVEQLGEVADGIRQLYTDFGLRPYEIRSVIIRWSGGERHRGIPEVISATPLLPTPLIQNIEQLSEELRPSGTVERGIVRLTEISPRYTRDDIMVLFPRALAPGEEHFIEATIDDRDGLTMRLRYVISGIPELEADQFQWAVRMIKQDEDRTRDGRPR